MLEEYILTGDGKEYVDVNCVREALGIGKDSESNIFEWIAFLKKSNERSHSEMYKARGEKHEFEKKIREALGIVDEYADLIGLARKLKEDNDLLEEVHANNISMLKDYAKLGLELGIGSGDAESIKDYIDSLKKERDQLKEKCDKLKARANAAYGVSCGYSGNKAPAFLCDVISYSWEFSPINACTLGGGPSYRVSDDSIRVELSLTPTANYKGAFDLEDLKKYIQEYGREKKLSDFEIFCKLVDNFIDELCDKHNVVQPARSKTTRERIEYIFSALTDYRNMADSNFNKAVEFRKEKQAVENVLAELRAKVREIYEEVFGYGWEESQSYVRSLNDINEEYKRVVHNFEERTADWSKAQKEAFDRETELIHFKDAVAMAVCANPNDSNADILKAVEAVMERATELQFNGVDKDEYDKLTRLRSNICTALCLGGETSNEDILNAIADDSKESNKLTVFRNDVAIAIGMTTKDSNSDIINRVVDIKECHDKLRGEAQDLQNKYDDAESRFRFQSGLRQQWHARYESEHERANGVQKALDREREKCRVKDVSLETAKKQYEKVCSNLETAECAINGMKSKVRELREEKTKVISAIGQDIWDDCVK